MDEDVGVDKNTIVQEHFFVRRKVNSNIYFI